MSLAINTNFARISANQVKFNNSQVQLNETPVNMPADRVRKNNEDISFTGFNVGKSLRRIVSGCKNMAEHIAESFKPTKKTLQIEEIPFVTGGNNGCPGTSGGVVGSSASGYGAHASDAADAISAKIDVVDALGAKADVADAINHISNAVGHKSAIADVIDWFAHIF